MSPVQLLVQALETFGVDVKAWALAWARVAPCVALVPAFGLRAVPAPVRISMALSLAFGIAPAVHPASSSSSPWPLQLLEQAARGLPVALSAAIALWTATMVGGLVDDLRGARERSRVPVVEPGATPTGVLLSMLVAVAFLESGGPGRVAAALVQPSPELHGALARVAVDLAAAVDVALAVGAPVLAASIVFEVGGALVARAASPAFIQPVLWPLRSIAILGITALLLDRFVALLVARAAVAP